MTQNNHNTQTDEPKQSLAISARYSSKHMAAGQRKTQLVTRTGRTRHTARDDTVQDMQDTSHSTSRRSTRRLSHQSRLSAQDACHKDICHTNETTQLATGKTRHTARDDTAQDRLGHVTQHETTQHKTCRTRHTVGYDTSRHGPTTRHVRDTTRYDTGKARNSKTGHDRCVKIQHSMSQHKKRYVTQDTAWHGTRHDMTQHNKMT